MDEWSFTFLSFFFETSTHVTKHCKSIHNDQKPNNKQTENREGGGGKREREREGGGSVQKEEKIQAILPLPFLA